MPKKGYKQTLEHKAKSILNLVMGKQSGKHWKIEDTSNMGKHHPKSEFKKGVSSWNKNLKGYRSGEKCPFWKGGITSENRKIRTSLEYKTWRSLVFERDGYKCVLCGCNKSGQLNADHIKPFALYPKLRLDINNGRTLCVECHKKTFSYMNNKLKINSNTYGSL